MTMRPAVGGRAPVLGVFVGGLLVAITTGIVGGTVQPVEYVWTTGDVDYTSNGQRLGGSVTATYDNAYLVTQCAFRCLQTTPDQCASYNFLPAQRKCELSSASHVTSPNNLLPVVDSMYYLRSAFSIDEAALGPCANSPCNNQGTCLTVASSAGVMTSHCLCRDGWTGSTCDVMAVQPMWNAWSDWSQCSTSCGNGVKIRHRQCMNQKTGGPINSQQCYGLDTEQIHCYIGDCPGWSNYGAWSQCSTDNLCGPGNQMRTRTCNNGGTPGVDLMCMGPINQTTPCLSPSCNTAVRLVNGPTYGEGRVNIYDDVNDIWIPVCASPWTKADADVVCVQLGFHSGSYPTQSASYGNEPNAKVAVSNVRCHGDESFLATCLHATWHDASCGLGPHAGVQCIVDGQWSNWSGWSECSVTCANGVLTRQRQCKSPSKQRGGKDCVGSATDTTPCTAAPCPVDAYWSAWNTWSSCNATCGGGTQSRTRVCHQALYGGRVCDGDDSQVQACNTHPCPVDGTWNTWSDWGSCNVSCGTGMRLRVRTCAGPFNGGAPCQGSTQDTAFCNDNPCAVQGSWSQWSRWLDCSVSCGPGTQNRYRTCDGASNGGSCGGNTRQDENQVCNNGHCPVDCTWSDWSTWASCNAPCGGGASIRTRTMSPALYGGINCTGQSQQSLPCNTNPCFIPGLWTQWSDWSPCSATCGTNGLRMRQRFCNMTSFGSLTSACLPTNGVNATDSKVCNVFDCSPTASTCAELFGRGLEDNTSFVYIDVDGDGILPLIGVECQRNNSVITTLIHTNNEVETVVQNYPLPGDYISVIQYVDHPTGNVLQTAPIISLVDRSRTCMQYISWRCYAAAMNSPAVATGSSYRITWWMNRQNKTMTYWGGATPSGLYDNSPTTMCACGQTSSCAKPNTKCNCDAEDSVWRVDDGFIRSKLDLPILTFRAGDTGSDGKQGRYIVGPLICN